MYKQDHGNCRNEWLQDIPLIEIRRAEIEDAAALRLLVESMLEEDEPWIRDAAAALENDREWIQNFIKDDRAHSEDGGKFLFFALDGDKLVGHVNGMSWVHAPKEIFDKIVRKYSLEGGKPGNVGIAVHKDYRRQGLGSRLIQRALQEFKEMEVTVVIAGVNADNGPSLLFFDKMGFEVHKSEGNQVLLKRRISCGK